MMSQVKILFVGDNTRKSQLKMTGSGVQEEKADSKPNGNMEEGQANITFEGLYDYCQV